jgi:hypothetical protein
MITDVISISSTMPKAARVIMYLAKGIKRPNAVMKSFKGLLKTLQNVILSLPPKLNYYAYRYFYLSYAG